MLRRLERIEVTPKSVVLKSAEATVPITVRAFFETGEQFDVTADALFSTAENGGLRLETNNVTVVLPGQHSVLVRYLSKVAMVNVTLPYADPIRADSLERNNFVDDAINRRVAMGQGGLPIAAMVDALPTGLPVAIEERSAILRDGFPDLNSRAREVARTSRAWLDAHSAVAA